MIKVCLARDSQGFIQEFSIEGHAGYADCGKDIVCAAISAIAYTALGALQELAGICNYIEKDGFIKCNMPKEIEQHSKYKAQIILDAMTIGFKQIEQEYKKHVMVLEKEV
jgi:uncharacterized protein YsxB (DUF464 family)